MKRDTEVDVIGDQVSELLDQGREKGLREEDESAIAAEVDMLWARLFRARPKRPRRRAQRTPPLTSKLR